MQNIVRVVRVVLVVPSQPNLTRRLSDLRSAKSLLSLAMTLKSQACPAAAEKTSLEGLLGTTRDYSELLDTTRGY